MAEPLYKIVDGGLVLRVRLTPKSALDAVGDVVDGPDGQHLAVKVRAIPDKGAANAAAEKTVAKWLGVAPSSVRLTTGSKSRLKTLKISGDGAALAAGIEAWRNPDVPASPPRSKA